MLLDEDKVTEAAQFHRQRCATFGARTAEQIRAARRGRFSLLPHEALVRLACGWYDASAQAMLNGNYALIDKWTQTQARLAAGQNFELGDMLELLRICRASAIQDEKWSEDILSVVDDAINEALRLIGPQVHWNIPGSLDYLRVNASSPKPVPGTAPGGSADIPETWSGDNRRDFGRNWLRLPIRVRAAAGVPIDELTYTKNVSRSGLYFLTQHESYKLKMAVRITYPYWDEPGAINREYAAKVVRMDRMTDGSFGVAVEFTETLGRRPRD